MIRQETELRPAPKIFKETCRIDWNKGVKQIYDFIRGLSPYPAAWTELCVADGTRQVLKIYETEKVFASHEMIKAVSKDFRIQPFRYNKTRSC